MGGAPRGALGSGVCPSAWSRAVRGWGGVIVLPADVSRGLWAVFYFFP